MTIRRLFAGRAALLLIAGTLAACSATKSSGTFSTGVGGGGAGGDATGTSAGTFSGSGGDGSGGGLFDGGLGGSSSGGGPGCAEATQYVYTLAADNSLYKFDPPTLNFTLVGVLDCPSVFSPYSMAVDRDANAWVVFQDGSLFKVSTQNAHCTSTAFVPGQNGFSTFGMGFSTNVNGGTDETLYVSDSEAGLGSTKGLAKIDLQSLKLIPIGQYDKLSARAEMTGTGDAKLFGAFEGTPYNVAQIDKTNAQIVNQAPQNAINYAPGSSNFAFAAWGGDFWLFVGPGFSTDVFHYQPLTKQTTMVKTVDFEIVGAGVSTCAPIKPPS